MGKSIDRDMKYDFDKVIPRRDTNSLKWDTTPSKEVLPMWVADMDLKTAPVIIEALRKRVEHGIFGYTYVQDSYYEAVINWFSHRHKWSIQRDWIVYLPSVVPALATCIKALATPGDNILIQGPVYNHFYSAISNCNCNALSSSLIYANNTYTIDYEDLERKAADPKTTLMLLCNPHNPAGRVWKREELQRIGDICIRHNVTVVSDEIHCELIMPGHTHIPFASVSEEFLQHSVTCMSPSKAFNTAGLQIANIVCADAERRAKIAHILETNEMCMVNPFGIIAAEAAYNEGEEWLKELLKHIYGNYQYMQEFCCKHLPEFPLTTMEATYLVWMNCSILGMTSAELERELIQEGKLWINSGSMYGPEGEGFMRWNIACPREMLMDGLQRFVRYVKNSE